MIINLAMQAVLSAYSKAKHYDPALADKYDEDVETATLLHDVVGLIRVIVVKVCVMEHLPVYFPHLML